MDTLLKNKTKECINLLFTIRNLMTECDINFGTEKRIKNVLNPYYNQMEINSCIVIEDYYRLPNKIYTPLGYILITSGFTSYNGNSKELFDTKMKELGFEFYKEPYENSIGEIGGWRKNNGDVKMKNPKDFIEYHEAHKLFEEFLIEEGLMDYELR